VSAALGDGKDVVDFLNGSQPTFFQTQLTQRMLRSIPVTDAFPRSAVGLVDVRVTLVLVVPLPFLFSVFLTVLTVRKVGTAGERTRSFRFARHLLTSVPGIRKALEGLLPRRLVSFFFADYIIS